MIRALLDAHVGLGDGDQQHGGGDGTVAALEQQLQVCSATTNIRQPATIGVGRRDAGEFGNCAATCGETINVAALFVGGASFTPPVAAKSAASIAGSCIICSADSSSVDSYFC